ncbi:hypothetical protein ACUMHR_21025 [Rossellomorea marisflavi]|uniref:hypothetical protein n=1 Tax=Rossellomorea marisflavi TaxID=189381 RepID=UPI004044D111
MTILLLVKIALGTLLVGVSTHDQNGLFKRKRRECQLAPISIGSGSNRHTSVRIILNGLNKKKSLLEKQGSLYISV